MEQATFAEKVLKFNAQLKLDIPLPEDIRAMNPFRDNVCALSASRAFYGKYYNNLRFRGMILGINPGRFGAGITGVPFTDPKRLAQFCQINISACPSAREPSSEFVYDVITAYGGPEKFYKNWYINSLCPLGFIKKTNKGSWVNYNYYDDPRLQAAVLPFIVKSLQEQLSFGIHTENCLCLGTGKNASFLKKLNAVERCFENIIALEHPRYIMQYKSGERQKYVDKYLQALLWAEKSWQRKNMC